MKTHFRQTTALFCVGATLLFGAVTVRADDETKVRHHRRHQESTHQVNRQLPTRDGRHSQEVEGHAVGGANGSEYRVRTGSHIPQRYNRRGYTTDSADNVFIYDQNDQRLRSTNNVSDSLRSVPGVSVRGSR